MKLQTKRGDCEASHFDGKGVDVTITQTHHNMWLCDECLEKENAITAKTKNVDKFLADSRKIDSSIQMKQDIYTAKTVPAIELLAAINADESIPADMKEYAFTQECMIRYQNAQKAVFEYRQGLQEKENEMRMWQVNVQTTAAKLRVDLREQFKTLDVNYQPPVATAKTIKPKVVKVGTKAAKLADVKSAAKKYDVPYAGVQMMCQAQAGLSAEDAARKLAIQMKKILPESVN